MNPCSTVSYLATKKNRIAVSALLINQQASAQALAAKLNLPYTSDPHTQQYDYVLLFTPDYLCLQTRNQKTTPLYVDFLSKKMQYRQQHAGLRKELLAKAIGIRPSLVKCIVDATAGLGRDSFILASLGYPMVMLERSPILHALLQDGLDRYNHNQKQASLRGSLELIYTDSIAWLAHAQEIDVVYLDPMFPARKKSAAVKKEMIILQNLLGQEADSHELFYAALTCAKHRVVVKRPRLAPYLAECTPSFSMTGKSSRFDIYMTT